MPKKTTKKNPQFSSLAPEAEGILAGEPDEAHPVPRRDRCSKYEIQDRKNCLITAAMHNNGASRKAIAATIGTDVRAVDYYLAQCREAFPKLEELDVFRASRQLLIEAAEAMALESLSKKLPEESNKLRERAYAFQVIHHASRLERGVSTANVSQRVTFTDVNLEEYATPPSD